MSRVLFFEITTLEGRWRRTVSMLNRLPVLEEIQEFENKIVDLLPVRYLSIHNTATQAQPVCQVVKVCGTITVSF